MKILLTTGIYPPDIGGPATYSKFLFDELPKKGHEVTVLSFGEVRKYPKLIRHILFCVKAWKLSKKVDVIFAQDTMSVGLPSLCVAKLRHKRFLIRVPGDYVWEQSVQRFGVTDDIDTFQTKKQSLLVHVLRCIQSFVVSHADRVITPSQYFANLVSAWGGKKKIPVTVIYNGIVPFGGVPSVNEQRELSIFSSGRLVPWKGFEVLIELMSELENWKLFIAGEGPERKKLEQKIEALHVQDRVVLLGSVPRETVHEYLKKSTVFVLNTSFESFSFQVVEAMSAGIPVVTTNIGNLSEIIENGKEGILVEPNNKQEILGALNRISNDVVFREALIKNALEKSKVFSLEHTLKNLDTLLRSL